MFKAELEHQHVDNIAKRMEKEFPAWFEDHVSASFYMLLFLHQCTNVNAMYSLQISSLHRDTNNVDEDLYSLACRPDRRVRSYSACVIHGVRFHTMAREAGRKTQNSGIKAEGTHKDESIDFYGVLTEIIELNYIANKNGPRSVILLRCEWFNLEGKTYQLNNDGYFKSINIGSRWYKNDPFILSTQASQVFYLDDTKLGKSWQVVQEFGHRHIYDVDEAETSENIQDQLHMRCQEAYQQENSTLANCVMGGLDPNMDLLGSADEPGSPVSADIVDKLRLHQQQLEGNEIDSEDEDDTFLEYHSHDEGNFSDSSTDDE